MDDCNRNDGEQPFTEEVIGSYRLWLSIADDDFNANKKTLFATMIWHGARALSKYLISEVPNAIKGKSVIEFGSGAGLPSLICHKIGAAIVTSSDYPAPSVIQNLRTNAFKNIVDVCPMKEIPDGTTYITNENSASENDRRLIERNFHVIEHTWGEDVTSLLQPLNDSLYDTVIASECLWKSDTHENFAMSIDNVLKPGGTAHLSFSHHIPGLENNDLSFFDVLKRRNFTVTRTTEITVPHMWSDRSAVLYIYDVMKCP
jgi:EEF1A N-terminal glycine/lysine methyltransferase